MTTLSIDEMKQRILKPKRTALNANQTHPADSQTKAPSQTPLGGSRGETHPPVESGSVANQTTPPFRFPAAAAVPPFQGVYGGTTPLRIPKPSELFGVSAGFPRPSPPGTAPHPTLQRLPEPSGVSPIPQLPTPGLLSAASVTRQREHDRRLRALSTKMQRANLKRRLEASQGLVAPTNPWSPLLNENTLPSPLSGGAWPGILSGLKQWISGGIGPTDSEPSVPSRAPEHDAGVHLEFDTDVVDALVYTVGRWMGLDIDQLRDSPGLRTLVSRNIQWFRASPDWMKLLGLVLAKKLNHSLDTPRRSPSDTQRMLMERLLQTVPVAAVGQSTNEVVVSTVESSTPTAEVVPPTEASKPRKKYTTKTKQTPAKRKASVKSIPTKRARGDTPKATKKPKKTPMTPGTKPISEAPKKTQRHTRKRSRPSPDPLADPPSPESPIVSLDMAPVVSNPTVPESDDLQPTDPGPSSVLYSVPNHQPSHGDWESE